MKFLNKSKFVLLFPLENVVPFKYALHKPNYRQYAATANKEWIDLEAICKTGNIPKTFNFARDVFEKHVVSRKNCLFSVVAKDFTVKTVFDFI